tara:strand:+ start:255 stop:503 length:249 start_codon:yes stop_codon:yes gene_type:complete
MQKLVNVIAITSGVVSLAVVGLGGYVFIRKDAIIEDAKTKILEQVTGGLGGALVPDGLGGGGLDIPSLSPTPSEPALPTSPF